jgi:two-component sensor histidine kinase
MITINIIKEGSEEKEEFTVSFPKIKPKQYDNEKYLTLNFPYESLLNELDISMEILAPYNFGEDFIFIHTSKLWTNIDLYSFDPIHKRFKIELPNLGNSKFFNYITNAYENQEETTIVALFYYGNEVLAKIKQTIYYDNGLIFVVSELLNKNTRNSLDVFDKYSQAIFWVKNKTIYNKNTTVLEFEDYTHLGDIKFEDLKFKNLTNNEWLKVYDKLINRELLSYEDELVLHNEITNETFYVKVYANPITVDNETVLNFNCINITDNHNVELELEEYTQDLKTIQKISKFAINYGYIESLSGWSDEIFEIFDIPITQWDKYDNKLILYKNIPKNVKKDFNYFKTHPSEYNYVFERKFPITTLMGVEKFLNLHVVFRKNYQDNKKSKITAIVQDISVLVRNEKELEEYNVELNSIYNDNKLLLKEVHNRVKNNLQIILSLLNLDMRYNRDNPEQTLSNTNGYIRSMAFMHEKTYQSDSLNGANVKDYVETLSENILGSYSDNITLHCDIDNIELSNDIIVPLGLIINELVVNTREYAFPNNEEGNLSISLKSYEDNIILNVKDNGVGLENPIIFNNSSTLGFTLIQTLTSQIGGNINIVPSNEGLNVKLEFSKLGGKFYGE